MAKYIVDWDDCEDGVSGQPFEIEGKNLVDAYFNAQEKIRNFSPYMREHFCGIDINGLTDESGKYHLADYFLEKDYETDSKGLENILTKENKNDT